MAKTDPGLFDTKRQKLKDCFEDTHFVGQILTIECDALTESLRRIKNQTLKPLGELFAVIRGGREEMSTEEADELILQYKRLSRAADEALVLFEQMLAEFSSRLDPSRRVAEDFAAETSRDHSMETGSPKVISLAWAKERDVYAAMLKQGFDDCFAGEAYMYNQLHGVRHHMRNFDDEIAALERVIHPPQRPVLRLVPKD